MIYKLQTGGVIKLQNAGSLPKWMQKLNSWSIPDSDESAGERILNSTIEQANNASTQEERDQIYKDSAKKNLAVTGQSLMMIPMLNEFATYGLLGGGLRLGAGIAGSKAGEYVLGKGGDWADKKLNTKFLGTTGRILGGLGGWWGGSSATTPLFRNLAGKGITLHMPQETFMNLRGQYFDRAAKNIKLDTSTLPKLQYRDRLTKDYLEFGPDSNIYGDNVSKLVHWDPMTTGTRSALPINGGFNRDPVYFPHFENGKLVPAIGQIRSKLGNGQMYEHPYHPIFFGGNKPWWETPGSNFSDQYLKQTTFDKSKFTGPKQYYDRWAKTERRNLRNLRNWYTKYGPQNKSDRYLITDPENLVDYEFSHKLGIMGSEVPMSKLEGFEYDPLLGTFKRAKYIDPSISTVPPQEAATTYHFDGRMPLTRPISEFERNGKYTLDELHQMGFKLPRKHLQSEDAIQMFKEYGTQYPETTRLYRITGTSGKFVPSPDGTEEFAGQWFTNDPEKGLLYGSRTAKQARKIGVENPIELQVVDIPNSQLEHYRASNILKGRTDVEYEPTEDFLIPLDMPRGRAPMDFTGNALLDNKLELPNIPIQDTPLMQQLRKYVPEARERYGLVGNTNITDDEIAGSLYKKALELGGDTAAVNEFEEPLVLFRGDTKRYNALRKVVSPEELKSGRGSMDNSFGNLFLGQLDRPGEGVERYIHYVHQYPSGATDVYPSATGERLIWNGNKIREQGAPIFIPEKYLTYDLGKPFKRYGEQVRVRKISSELANPNSNDINAFVVRTPAVRNSSSEISPEMGGEFINLDGVPKFKNANYVDREQAALRIRQILDNAKLKNQGLLKSDAYSPLRENEHFEYDYYALPNFNIRGAKHILPFDFRIPTQWNSRIIYRKQGGIIKGQDGIPESAKAKSYFAGLKDYILHKTKSFIPSQYKPTKGNNIQVQYYTRPGLKEEVALNLFGGTDKNAKNFIGDSNYFYKDFDEAYQDLSKEYIANSSRTASNGTLGEYGVSAGTDDNGRYISFIDNFDHVFIPGKGIPIYDRIYENEINSVYNKNRSAFDEGDWITKSPVLQKLKKKQTK